MELDSLLDILYEDDDLLVVNKPAGLVCHPTKNGERSSLIGRVRLHLGHAEGGLVNRLDRETSGIVVLAKRADVAGELGRLFVSSQVCKTYLAIVHGHPARECITIAASIGDDVASPVAIKGCVRPDGAEAETAVSQIRTWSRDGEPFALLEVTPRTGRKHQIRIHLAHIGHPIVGDKLYGADERRYLRLVENTLTPEDWRALRVEHHALHAARVSFAWRDRQWTWEAPESIEFRAFACFPDDEAERPSALPGLRSTARSNFGNQGV
jgi:23S rRNA pseudouridine1911/1915/1917 synthase